MKMKSSSPSSSSISLSSKTQTFGCLSLFLHRFLCSGTSSSYPSDQTNESCFKSPAFSPEPSRAQGDEPGAVARLMGLDSIPRAVSRSRSVNSLDHENDEIQGKLRRVKSNLEYAELEDDNFFILSFEKGKENNINFMNVSSGHERLDEVEEMKTRRKQERKKRRESKSRQNIEKEEWIERYLEVEEECGSCDDSSPVSVLDYDSSSARRLSSLFDSSNLNEMNQEDRSVSSIQHHRYQDMWLMICSLTVSEIEGSKWVYGKAASKLEDFEGIVSEDIVSNILDQLLEETVKTLSLTSQM